MARRSVLTAVTVVVLALAGCGAGDSPSRSDTTGTAASVTDTSPSPVEAGTTGGTKPAGGTGEPSQAAPCTAAAMQDVVVRALGTDIEGTVKVAECRGGYARAFYHPEATNFETEQLFLADVGGAWTVLTYGTGIECTDDDLRPAGLEKACVALGLRPAASAGSGVTSLTLDEVNARVLRDTTGGLANTVTAFSCEPYHGGLTTGGVLVCRPDPEPTDGQFPILTVLVLDGGAGTIAWAQAGVENPTLNADGLISGSGPLPRGLNCTNLVAHPSFEADIAGRLDPTLTYFATVLYWFLADRPTPLMDVDSNGIPCETLFDADVVQTMWAGGYLT